METIRTYLENMFAGLPRTAQVNEIKNNILTNMEEKYLELKSQGKSENEAIGIVISEFGNIDELTSELGLKSSSDENTRTVSRDEVMEYKAVKKATGIQVALGVFLCILAPIVLILITALDDNEIIRVPENTGVILLFILIAVAVGIFIKSGMSLEPYKYIEEGVLLPYDLEHEIRQEYKQFTPMFNLSVIIGVCLIILSPICLFIASNGSDLTNQFGVVIMLFLINIAVAIFIFRGNQKSYYELLLKVGDYTPSKRDENKLIGAVASIIWPLAVIIFLISGLVFHLWYINWIIFPITGLLFGMFSATYSIMKGDNKS